MPIRLESVHYSYPNGLKDQREALKDVNLLFADNCFTALIGKTGSGKSTLMQHLNALLLPTSGKVEIGTHLIDMSLEYKKNGKVSTRKMKRKQHKKLKDVKELRKKVGLVFQFPEYQLFEETVLKDVSYGPKNFGSSQEESEEAAKIALKQVGLDESFYQRSPFELSGGEKRRVSIAGILALKPDVLVLDEPTVGLDSESEESLMALLSSLHASGTSIIIATHDMDVVLKYCTRAIVLDKGLVVKDTTPIELFQDVEFLKTSSLQPPRVFSFALRLLERGFNLNLKDVKDAESLALEIAKRREHV